MVRLASIRHRGSTSRNCTQRPYRPWLGSGVSSLPARRPHLARAPLEDGLARARSGGSRTMKPYVALETAAPLPFAPSMVVDHPSGFLALSPRNQLFAADGIAGFIAYREQGRHQIAFGGAHAEPPHQGELLDKFLACPA